MADPVSIAAGISSLLKALGSAGVYLKSAASASREAQEIANQVHTTEAFLKSLKASLKSVHRSDEFNNIWADSTRLVLRNIKATIEELNGKLGARRGASRLSFWQKTKWPLTREDSLMLQQHMGLYMQMLSMVQNAFMQGTMQTAQQSAKDIDDIFTEIGTFPTLSSGVSSGSWSIASQSTLTPGDSVSQLGVSPASPPPSQQAQTWASAWPEQPSPERPVSAHPNYSIHPTLEQPSMEKVEAPSLSTKYTVQNLQIVSSEIYNKRGALKERIMHEPAEELGCGNIVFSIGPESRTLYMTFSPQGLESYKSRWILNPSELAKYPKAETKKTDLGEAYNPALSKPNYFLTFLNALTDTDQPSRTLEAVTLVFRSQDDKHSFEHHWQVIVEIARQEFQRREQEQAVKERAARMRR